jgi:hypothetical protein
MSASEPLLTCRKRRDEVKTGRESLLQDKSKGNLLTAWVASKHEEVGLQFLIQSMGALGIDRD